MIDCPYCHQPAKQVGGGVIYPHRPDLFGKVFYHCAPCDAYVGAHVNSGKPFGRLANRELRMLRKEAHRLFDPLWKSGDMRRRQAYEWLAEAVGVPFKQCHIGDFDETLCRRVIDACTQYVPE